MQSEIDSYDADSNNAEMFVELAKKFTDFSELTTPMIHEFVEKIVVHEADKTSGQRIQKVDIHLNFISKFDMQPAEPTLEETAAFEKLERQRERKKKNYRT
jgi:hypothetical protein